MVIADTLVRSQFFKEDSEPAQVPRPGFALTFGGLLIRVGRGRDTGFRDWTGRSHEKDSRLTLHVVAAPGRSRPADLSLALLSPGEPATAGGT